MGFSRRGRSSYPRIQVPDCSESLLLGSLFPLLVFRYHSRSAFRLDVTHEEIEGVMYLAVSTEDGRFVPDDHVIGGFFLFVCWMCMREGVRPS